MRYQQSWSDIAPETVDEAGQRNLEATILRALELGINHIETARGYGSSEMQLGYILPRLPRDKMIVQTKVAPFASVLFDHIVEAIYAPPENPRHNAADRYHETG